MANALGLQITGTRPLTVRELERIMIHELHRIGLDVYISIEPSRSNPSLDSAEVYWDFRSGLHYIFLIDRSWIEGGVVQANRMVRAELAKVCLMHGLAPVEIGMAGEERVRGRSFTEISRDVDPPTTPRIPAAPPAVPPRSYYYDTPKGGGR